MAVCILSIFSYSITGLTGSLVLSVAHGFVSSGLLIKVGERGIRLKRKKDCVIYLILF